MCGLLITLVLDVPVTTTPQNERKAEGARTFMGVPVRTVHPNHRQTERGVGVRAGTGTCPPVTVRD